MWSRQWVQGLSRAGSRNGGSLFVRNRRLFSSGTSSQSTPRSPSEVHPHPHLLRVQKAHPVLLPPQAQPPRVRGAPQRGVPRLQERPRVLHHRRPKPEGARRPGQVRPVPRPAAVRELQDQVGRPHHQLRRSLPLTSSTSAQTRCRRTAQTRTSRSGRKK